MKVSLNKTLFFTGLVVSGILGSQAHASSMMYVPQNGAIFSNANPNGQALLQASAPRPYDPKSASFSSGLTDAEILKQSILAQASSAINNEIFNGISPQGTFPLGDGSTVSYVRNGAMVTITFTAANGTQTVITVPAHI